MGQTESTSGDLEPLAHWLPDSHQEEVVPETTGELPEQPEEETLHKSSDPFWDKPVAPNVSDAQVVVSVALHETRQVAHEVKEKLKDALFGRWFRF